MYFVGGTEEGFSSSLRCVGALILMVLCPSEAVAQRSLSDFATDRNRDHYHHFRAFEERFFSVRATNRGHNDILFQPEGSGAGTVAELACLPQTHGSEPAPAVELWIAMACLREDVPSVDPEGLHVAAVADAQRWVEGLELSSHPMLHPADLAELQQWASSRVQEQLLSTGLVDFLAGSWRRHMMGRSACYRSKSEELHHAIDSFFREGGRCDRWRHLIEVEPGPGHNLERKIRFRDVFQGSSELATVEKLRQLGLRPCLASLLENHGDPALMEQIGFYKPVYNNALAMTDYAWRVWREQGVTNWFERALTSERVPRSPDRVVSECAAQWPYALETTTPKRERVFPRGRGPWIGPADPKQEKRRRQERYPVFARFPHDFFSVEVVEQEGVLMAQAQVNGPLREEELYCAPPPPTGIVDPTPEHQLDLVLLLRFLREDGEIDMQREHRAAVREIQRWLDREHGKRSDELSPEELMEIHQQAQVRLFERLRDAGLFDYLLGAWRYYVRGQSERYVSASKAIRKEKESFLEVPLRCPPWEELLSAHPYLGFELKKAVLLRGLRDNQPSHRAIAALEEVGLTECLGRLLEAASGEREQRELRVEFPSASLTSPDHARKIRYARYLWRQHGLDDWVRRTLAAGSAPEDVAVTVSSCAEGILPTPVGPGSEAP